MKDTIISPRFWIYDEFDNEKEININRIGNFYRITGVIREFKQACRKNDAGGEELHFICGEPVYDPLYQLTDIFTKEIKYLCNKREYNPPDYWMSELKPQDDEKIYIIYKDRPKALRYLPKPVIWQDTAIASRFATINDLF